MGGEAGGSPRQGMMAQAHEGGRRETQKKERPGGGDDKVGEYVTVLLKSGPGYQAAVRTTMPISFLSPDGSTSSVWSSTRFLGKPSFRLGQRAVYGGARGKTGTGERCRSLQPCRKGGQGGKRVPLPPRARVPFSHEGVETTQDTDDGAVCVQLQLQPFVEKPLHLRPSLAAHCGTTRGERQREETRVSEGCLQPSGMEGAASGHPFHTQGFQAFRRGWR